MVNPKTMKTKEARKLVCSSSIRFRFPGVFSAVLLCVVQAWLGERGAWAATQIVVWGGSMGQTNIPPGLTNVVAITAGGLQSVALRDNGKAVNWPYDDNRQVPTYLSNVVAVSAGIGDTWAIRADGTVGRFAGVWSRLEGYSNIVAVSAGGNLGFMGGANCLFLGTDSTVRSYGFFPAPLGMTNIIAIAAGGAHSMALQADGTVTVWGRNIEGQTNVPPGLSNVVAISAGGDYCLALKADGTVAAWGRNDSGQINVPSGLTNVVAISAGYYHSLALRRDGTVVAWGWNDYGQTNVPNGLTNVVAIAAGYEHNVALVANPDLQITTTLLPQTVPAGSQVQFSIGASGAQPISYQWRFNGIDLPGETNFMLNLANVQTNQSGAYSVVVSNPTGTLASREAALVVAPVLITSLWPIDPTTWQGATVQYSAQVNSTVPVSYQWQFNGTDLPGATNSVLTLSNLTRSQSGTYAVKASNVFGEVRRQDSLYVGMIACWGSIYASAPRLSDVAGMSASGNSQIFLKLDGNIAPQPWYGTDPRAPTNHHDIVGISAGRTAGLALRKNGRIVAWGGCCVASSGNISLTNPPPSLTNAIAIATGLNHGAALRRDGTVVVWGIPAAPVLPVLSNAVAITASYSHVMALKKDGTVDGWSASAGDPQTNMPPDLTNVIAIAAGESHSLALKRDGTVVSWGNNQSGQTNVPPDLANVVAIAGGATHSLALKADGSVVAWGSQTNVPAELTNIVAIAAADGFSLALIDGGDRPTLAQQKTPSQSLDLSAWTFLRKNYTLECATSISDTNWHPVMSVSGNGSWTTFTDTNATSSQGFYRLRVE